jgi:hypothetical protein
MADEGFTRLNREFYAADPSVYFLDRLMLLALRASKSDALRGLSEDGIKWGQIEFGATKRAPKNEGDPEDDDDAVDRSRYVVAESEILLHHVAEALIRMFLAHEDLSECPWIDMAELKLPGAFKGKLTELASGSWSQDRIDAVSDVFIGPVPEVLPPELVERRDAGVRLLRMLANRLLDDANLYNSAKHGLSAVAGSGSISILTQGGDHLAGADGVNVTFLEPEGKPKTGIDWYQTTQWVIPEQTAFLAYLTVRQMESLWKVARWRYLDEHPEGGLPLVTNEALDLARDGFTRGGPIKSWRLKVAHTEPPHKVVEDPRAPTSTS